MKMKIYCRVDKSSVLVSSLVIENSAHTIFPYDPS
jgi:hypothetical protein